MRKLKRKSDVIDATSSRITVGERALIDNSACRSSERQLRHYEPIPLSDWPMSERLGSLILSVLICLFASVAVLIESAIFGQLVLAVIALGAVSAVSEDAADTWDALKQLVPITGPTHRKL